MTYRIVLPIKRAPYITGCRETHVLAVGEDGVAVFVPREWLQDSEEE